MITCVVYVTVTHFKSMFLFETMNYLVIFISSYAFIHFSYVFTHIHGYIPVTIYIGNYIMYSLYNFSFMNSK